MVIVINHLQIFVYVFVGWFVVCLFDCLVGWLFGESVEC